MDEKVSREDMRRSYSTNLRRRKPMRFELRIWQLECWLLHLQPMQPLQDLLLYTPCLSVAVVGKSSIYEFPGQVVFVGIELQGKGEITWFLWKNERTEPIT